MHMLHVVLFDSEPIVEAKHIKKYAHHIAGSGVSNAEQQRWWQRLEARGLNAEVNPAYNHPQNPQG